MNSANAYISKTDGLPNWDAGALAAIAAAFLRSGERAMGRRLLQQIRQQPIDEDIIWRSTCHAHRYQPWAIAITAQAQGGDFEGALASAQERTEAFEQALGLILVGEVQVEAGDFEGGWDTFQAAVAASGEPDMATTSLSDIALGAAWTGKEITAQFIAERLNNRWLGEYLKEAAKKGSPLFVHVIEGFYENDPAYRLRSVYNGTNFHIFDSDLRRATELAAAALYLRENGKLAEAKKETQKAKQAVHRIRDAQIRGRAWGDIVNLHLSASEWAAAIDSAEKIPDPCVRGYTFYSIGKIQLWRGDLASAVVTAKRAEKAVELERGSSSGLVSLSLMIAEALLQQQQTSTVIAHFDRAWQVASRTDKGWSGTDTYKEARSTVIIALAKAGYLDEAIRRYREAAQQNQNI